MTQPEEPDESSHQPLWWVQDPYPSAPEASSEPSGSHLWGQRRIGLVIGLVAVLLVFVVGMLFVGLGS